MVENKEDKVDTVIGIDLGTFNSVVGVYDSTKKNAEGKTDVEIAANAEGKKLTRSVVSFGAKVKVGEGAMNQLKLDPDNVVKNWKEMIGIDEIELKIIAENNKAPEEEKKEDAEPKEDDNEDKIAPPALPPADFEVEVKGEKIVVTPQYCATQILRALKETAEKHAGKQPLTHAVITVPANFNENRKNAVRQAGVAAGLNVLRVVNEPTAAAIAYGLEQKDKTAANVLVYDFGGGTLDCTVLNIDKTKDKDEYAIKSSVGDVHLGGNDFSNLLYVLCANKIEDEHDIDLSEKKFSKAAERVLSACEQAKIDLSTAQETVIEIESLANDKDIEMTITRDEFYQCCEGLFKKSGPVVEKVLAEAELTADQIDEIVLVGGTTRIPKVLEDLQALFPGKTLNYKVNPDEAVAHGAAILAAQLEKLEEGIDIVDIIPLPLGLEVEEGTGEDMKKVMDIIIKKNEAIPCEYTKTYTTVMNHQPQIQFSIFQGESVECEENTKLGKIRLAALPLEPAGVPQVEVTFKIDLDGVLNVSAHLKGDEANAKKVDCKMIKATVNKKQIEQMANVQALAAFEDFIKVMKNDTADAARFEKLNEADKTALGVCIEQGDEFIAENPMANAAEYEEKTKEIQDFYEPLQTKMNA